MARKRLRRQRGSTLVEFVFVLPVGVALLVGCLSMAVACLRTVEAGQLARNVLLLADAGVDFGASGGKQKLIEQGKDLGLASGKAAIYIAKIVCEPAGYRVDQKYEMGDTVRWRSMLNDPSRIAELKPGESAWVVEVFSESGAIASFLPESIRVRSVL